MNACIIELSINGRWMQVRNMNHYKSVKVSVQVIIQLFNVLKLRLKIQIKSEFISATFYHIF